MVFCHIFLFIQVLGAWVSGYLKDPSKNRDLRKYDLLGICIYLARENVGTSSTFTIEDNLQGHNRNLTYCRYMIGIMLQIQVNHVLVM